MTTTPVLRLNGVTDDQGPLAVTWDCNGCGRTREALVRPLEVPHLRCCSPRCRDRASKAERRRRGMIAAHLETNPRSATCPTPFKKSWQTVEAARTFLWDQKRQDRAIDAYLCACGAVHVGHNRRRLGRNPIVVTPT